VLFHEIREEIDVHILHQYNSAFSLLLISIHGEVADGALDITHVQAKSIASQLDVALGILDLSEADISAITPEIVRALAWGPPILRDSARRCVVTPLAYQFGMARMFQIVSNRNIEICRSRGEAYAVLGIKVPSTFQTVTLDDSGRVVLSTDSDEQRAG
jgi:hypothetical protein